MNEPDIAPVTRANLDNLKLQVTPENVQQVATVLRSEADRLAETVRRMPAGSILPGAVGAESGPVGLCGGDPVSHDAAKALNVRINAMNTQMYGYVASLRAAADQLTGTASAYGDQENEAASSFRAFG